MYAADRLSFLSDDRPHPAFHGARLAAWADEHVRMGSYSVPGALAGCFLDAAGAVRLAILGPGRKGSVGAPDRVNRVAWRVGELAMRRFEATLGEGEKPVWKNLTQHDEIVDPGRLAGLLAEVGCTPIDGDLPK